uniref:Rab-GAP TBC domain-containing protein n=1 Tax=Guillardia theta TaxID=55529 RepID=A0A7S4KNV1_GUITH|mmetsp:Transcript_28106/g.91136  ORF Transcript_28106/g.91136 Transcript_28106/m.91136 type:complete len:450 (+) Transcript_28106:52-1401(+)
MRHKDGVTCSTSSRIWLLLVLVLLHLTVVTTSLFCDAWKPSNVNIVLRGGSGDREINQTCDDTAPYEEIVKMVEEMKSRVPDDMEVLSDTGAPVKMTNDPRTKQALREELYSFQVSAEGVPTVEEDEESDEEEDEYGPIMLLKKFWRSKEVQHLSRFTDGHLLPDFELEQAAHLCTNTGEIPSLSRMPSFFRTQEWPASCSADKIRGLPDVQPAAPRSELQRVASKFFTTRDFQTRFVTLLEFVAFDPLHAGLCKVAHFLSIFLPMATTARVIAVLQSTDHYISGYWRSANDVTGARQQTEVGVKGWWNGGDLDRINDAMPKDNKIYSLEGDVENFLRAAIEEDQALINHLQSKEINLRDIVKAWFETIFFDILPWQGRHRFLDGFLRQTADGGRAFLVKFGLSLLHHKRRLLMEAAEQSQLRQLLTDKVPCKEIEGVLDLCMASQQAT